VIRMVRSTPRFTPDISNSSATPVVAAQTIANIVKSSLGPLGLDKMLVDNIGVCFIQSCESPSFNTHMDTGSHDIKRRRHDPFSPFRRTSRWPYFCRPCTKTRQRGRRWHDFCRDHRCGAATPCKRARKSKNSSYHYHHGI